MQYRAQDLLTNLILVSLEDFQLRVTDLVLTHGCRAGRIKVVGKGCGNFNNSIPCISNIIYHRVSILPYIRFYI